MGDNLDSKGKAKHNIKENLSAVTKLKTKFYYFPGSSSLIGL